MCYCECVNVGHWRAEKHENQADFPFVEIKKDESFPFSGGGIMDISEAAELKIRKKYPKRMKEITW